jgi:hypothetical protein
MKPRDVVVEVDCGVAYARTGGTYSMYPYSGGGLEGRSKGAEIRVFHKGDEKPELLR